MTPIDVIGLLGSVASMASLIRESEWKGNIAGGLSYFRNSITTEHQKVFETEGGRKLLDILIINEGLFGDLVEEVKNAQDEYRKRLKNSSNANQRDAADRYVEKEVCEHLNRIRDRNKGVLPDVKDLQDAWESYKCVEF